jgi:hypothetical protein
LIKVIMGDDISKLIIDTHKKNWTLSDWIVSATHW